eukprot:2229983-Pyramimonas_sp.AAC.1
MSCWGRVRLWDAPLPQYSRPRCRTLSHRYGLEPKWLRTMKSMKACCGNRALKRIRLVAASGCE